MLFLLQAFMRTPPPPQGPPHVLFDHFWVEAGTEPVPEGPSRGFIVTPSVASYMRSLARAVLLKRNPILLQGKRQADSDRKGFQPILSKLVSA